MSRARILILAVFVFALCAAPAHAGGSHLVKLYKVEKHIDLDGEDAVYTATCPNGDYAIDGMYRMDAVDQDNEFGRLQLLSSVYPVAVYPSSDSAYSFSFMPTLGGDVQIKLWVTCLGKSTEPSQSHTHQWVMTSAVDFTTAVLPAGGNSFAHPTQCPSGYIAVQPGWRAAPGTTITPYASYFTSNQLSWQWSFILADPGALDVYHSCLRLKSTTVNSHAHRLVTQLKPGYSGSDRNALVSDNREDQTLSCGEHYKGMLGGFRIPDPLHVWYYGMEPRIKSRTFWFGNDGGGTPIVNLAVSCFKDKTT